MNQINHFLGPAKHDSIKHDPDKKLLPITKLLQTYKFESISVLFWLKVILVLNAILRHI